MGHDERPRFLLVLDSAYRNKNRRLDSIGGFSTNGKMAFMLGAAITSVLYPYGDREHMYTED